MNRETSNSVKEVSVQHNPRGRSGLTHRIFSPRIDALAEQTGEIRVLEEREVAQVSGAGIVPGYGRLSASRELSVDPKSVTGQSGGFNPRTWPIIRA